MCVYVSVLVKHTLAISPDVPSEAMNPIKACFMAAFFIGSFITQGLHKVSLMSSSLLFCAHLICLCVVLCMVICSVYIRVHMSVLKRAHERIT